jgi:nucleotide-binding universal stress UspA family protein
MQHILVPTDFSLNAWTATVYALEFFEKHQITFHFLHIHTLPQAAVNQLDRYEISRDLDKKGVSMDRWMERISTLYQNPLHRFKKDVVHALFIEGVKDYLKSQNIDLIVMGAKGSSGFKDSTLGSMTNAVIQRVKCTNLVIPENAVFKTPLTIGFPTDFNICYKHRLIYPLLRAAKIHQSSIKVLRIAQNNMPLDDFQRRNRQLLKQELNQTSNSFHLIIDRKLDTALQFFVSTMQVELIAMIAKNLNLFQRILFKPELVQISYHRKIPFLILHE